MATYEELVDLCKEKWLKERVRIAIVDVALGINVEDAETPNHANRYVWASHALQHPGDLVDGVLHAVLVANKAADKLAILQASDEQVKAGVEEIVDLLAGVEVA